MLMAGKKSLGRMCGVDTCLHVYLFSFYPITTFKEAWLVDCWEVLGGGGH